LLAFWPTQVFLVTRAQPTLLLVLAFVLLPLLWRASLDTQRLLPWIGYAIVASLAALLEPALLLPLGLSLGWMLLARRLPVPLRLRNATVLLAAAACLIGPWCLRNYHIHGNASPVAGTFWTQVWTGNPGLDPGLSGTDRPTLTQARRAAFAATGRDDVRPHSLLTDAQRTLLDGKSAGEREAIFGRWTRDWIAANPAAYATASATRFGKTLLWDWDNPSVRGPGNIYPLTRVGLLLATIIGLGIAIRSGWHLGHVALLAGGCVAIWSLTLLTSRQPLPLEPLQLALVGLVVARLLAGGGLLPKASRPPLVRSFLADRAINDGRSS
jgi:hypothetical protein